MKTMFVLRFSLLLLICLGTFSFVGPAANAGNRCKDRCNDAYRLRKDTCKLIPYKPERKRCEKNAKRAKDDCKHHCR